MIAFRIMSFNIRGSFVNDGDNAWVHRRDMNVAVIRDAKPDLIGFQELQSGNWSDYERLLPGYGRELGPRYNNDEPWCYPSIFWNDAMFQPVDRGEFWLSKTPGEFSASWMTRCIRSALWVRLRHRATGLTFVMLNTHLDHISRRARLNGAYLITRQLDAICRPGEPTIVTADFNCGPDSPAYRHFARNDYVDTFLEAGGADTPEAFTYHEFLGLRHPTYGRIDWILTRAGDAPITASNARIIRDASPPVYPSDHYPITVDLTMGN